MGGFKQLAELEMSECERKTRLFTCVLILLRATAVLDGLHKLLHCLVAQRGQIGGHVFAEQPYLGSRHQRENVLHVGDVLRPELIPEIVVLGADCLQYRQPGQRVRAMNRNPSTATYLGLGRQLDDGFAEYQFGVGVAHREPRTSNDGKLKRKIRRHNAIQVFDTTNAIWCAMPVSARRPDRTTI